ncbi:MAG: DUF5675 family protein [Candidatus Paceibacteria bacterium]
MIVLNRYYTPFGVWGDLEVEGQTFSTAELPWKGNQKNISAIPEGNYIMQMRESPVVKRTSGFEEGWEIQDVPGRSYIMFHVGNWPKRDSEGCVLVGREKNIVENMVFVSNSQDAFKEFMSLLEGRMEWEIQIKPWRPEYP